MEKIKAIVCEKVGNKWVKRDEIVGAEAWKYLATDLLRKKLEGCKYITRIGYQYNGAVTKITTYQNNGWKCTYEIE